MAPGDKVYSFHHNDHCTEITLRYDMDSNLQEL
jgi:hypothetical protein